MNRERTFGFIITRHVNSEKTNLYWNLCIQSIRKYYTNQIIVIDDNSNQIFVKEEFPYENVEYVQSEYVGRGELLPYYYFYINHYFDRAVIIHDSVFIQKKIPFHKLKGPVLPLWHFYNERFENPDNSVRLIQELKYREILTPMFYNKDKYLVLSMNTNTNEWVGCFGCQCFIDHNFLCKLQIKYNLFSLLKYVQTRKDRCCLERIMGILFYLNNPTMNQKNIYSLLGQITTYMRWGYTYDRYRMNYTNPNIMKLPIIKVWTGR